MYNNEMLESMKKVAAKRAENAALEPRRMTADEKDTLLATYHPDYKQNEFSVLEIGANKGEKVPLELCALLEGQSRLAGRDIDLTKPDYEADVLIIGGGGAGCSAAICSHSPACKISPSCRSSTSKAAHPLPSRAINSSKASALSCLSRASASSPGRTSSTT